MFYLDLIVEFKLFNTLFEMLNVSLELVSLCFLNQNLIWVSNLDGLFFLLAFGIFVLYFKYAE